MRLLFLKHTQPSLGHMDSPFLLYSRSGSSKLRKMLRGMGLHSKQGTSRVAICLLGGLKVEENAAGGGEGREGTASKASRVGMCLLGGLKVGEDAAGRGRGGRRSRHRHAQRGHGPHGMSKGQAGKHSLVAAAALWVQQTATCSAADSLRRTHPTGPVLGPLLPAAA